LANEQVSSKECSVRAKVNRKKQKMYTGVEFVASLDFKNGLKVFPNLPLKVLIE